MDTKIAFQLATSPEICKALGGRLRRLRLAQNLTAEELAARAGVHRRSVGNIENKAHTVALELIVRVAISLGVAEDLSPLFDERVQSDRAEPRASRQRARASSRPASR